MGKLTGCTGGTMRAADELHTTESVDATRLQHGEAAKHHPTVDTRCRRRVVPWAVRCAQLLIMNVVEHAVVWNKQRVTLERTDCTHSNTSQQYTDIVIHCSLSATVSATPPSILWACFVYLTVLSTDRPVRNVLIELKFIQWHLPK